MVFYCEMSAGFCREFGRPEEAEVNALLRIFKEALEVAAQLPAADRGALILRLAHVRTLGHNLGYGIGDTMDELLADFVEQ